MIPSEECACAGTHIHSAGVDRATGASSHQAGRLHGAKQLLHGIRQGQHQAILAVGGRKLQPGWDALCVKADGEGQSCRAEDGPGSAHLNMGRYANVCAWMAAVSQGCGDWLITRQGCGDWLMLRPNNRVPLGTQAQPF